MTSETHGVTSLQNRMTAFTWQQLTTREHYSHASVLSFHFVIIRTLLNTVTTEMALQFNTVLHLRLRMFLCSSSSVVGLWLRRLKREIYIVTLFFLNFAHFSLSLSQSTRLSASSGKTKKVNFSTDSLLCIICTSTNTHSYTKM